MFMQGAIAIRTDEFMQRFLDDLDVAESVLLITSCGAVIGEKKGNTWLHLYVTERRLVVWRDMFFGEGDAGQTWLFSDIEDLTIEKAKGGNRIVRLHGVPDEGLGFVMPKDEALKTVEIAKQYGIGQG